VRSNLVDIDHPCSHSSVSNRIAEDLNKPNSHLLAQYYKSRQFFIVMKPETCYLLPKERSLLTARG